MKYKNLVLGLILILIFASCENMKYDANVEAPDVSISVLNLSSVNLSDSLKTNDTVTFIVNSNAEHLSYYRGDSAHEFENSRTYALWQNGIDEFYNETYKRPVSPDKKTEQEWFFYNYNSLDEITAAGFSFSNITPEFGVYEQPSTAYMKVNNTKNLRLHIANSNVVSTFTARPTDLFINRNELGFITQGISLEMYWVSDQADSYIRDAKTLLGKCKMKVTYVTKDGRKFSSTDNGNSLSDNIQINYKTKNPFMYPASTGTFGVNKNIFSKRGNELVNEQIDQVIVQFGSGKGVPLTSTTPAVPDSLNYLGFSGDVYIVSMKIGGTSYYNWSEGSDLYSNYELEQTNEHIVKVVYDTSGTYNFWVVGTNVGRKVYTDENNYQNQYGFSSKDYDYKRTYVMETITIQ